MAVLLRVTGLSLWKPMSVSALIAFYDRFPALAVDGCTPKRTSSHPGLKPWSSPSSRRTTTAITRAGGSGSTPSSGSVVIRGEATLSVAIVSRDGLFPRHGVEAPTRLPGGLKVLKLPKVSG